jgi:hypothetical protein
VIALLLCCLQVPDYEKSLGDALERATRERRAVLMVFHSPQWKMGEVALGLLKNADVQKAAKVAVCVKVPIDSGVPKEWPAFLSKQQMWGGGLAILTPSGDAGEVRFDAELQTMGAKETAAWIAAAAERVSPIWESSVWSAEMRAKRESKPLVVMVGLEQQFGEAFRDPVLRDVLGRVVLLRVAGDSKRYTAPGVPGVVALDPLDRAELASWAGSKRGAELKPLLEKIASDWAAGATERRRRWESARPYLCGSCGFRSTEAETCCGDTMVKPEPPVWEKTFAAARERAMSEKRIFVYVVAKDPRQVTRVQELFSNGRLAALASRCILYAEEAAEAGSRPSEMGFDEGLAVWVPRDGNADPVLQGTLKGAPAEPDCVRELGIAVRRLRAAGSKK